MALLAIRSFRVNPAIGPPGNFSSALVVAFDTGASTTGAVGTAAAGAAGDDSGAAGVSGAEGVASAAGGVFAGGSSAVGSCASSAATRQGVSPSLGSVF